MKILFNAEKLSMVVQIEQEWTIPERVSIYASEHNLLKKDEFHITPITFSQGKELLTQFQRLNLTLEQQQVVIAHIIEYAHTVDWNISGTDTFYHIGKKYTFPNKTVEKESIVQTVESNGLDLFIQYINQLLSTNLESFGHVTLFTKSTDPQEKTPGIGISSKNELSELIITSI